MTPITPLLQSAQQAAAAVRRLSPDQKTTLLNRLADVLAAHTAQIVVENQKDLDRMSATDPKYDRLKLTEARITDLSKSLREVAVLPDPAGEVILERTIEQGLQLKKIAVPLGVVGVIYEARPNVTVDVASLCLRSGNACVLKGGKEADFSNRYLVGLIQGVLVEFGVPKAAVTLLPPDRAVVNELLTATRYVDIIIPRGSDSLIQFVRKNSLVPTIETGAGVCHAYVEASADLDKAVAIVVNARVSRPSVCNSLDCVLVDDQIAERFLPMLTDDFIKWNVEVFADDTAYAIFEKAGYTNLQHAQPEDFGREFLDYKCAVKVVNGLEEALSHIQAYSSRHSEAILSQNQALIDQFLREVDAAAVYANASTRFTDGGVFGLGAEIGISTQKLHARGPFALEKLVTEKWIVVGDGQVRW
ncbi:MULTISPECIES: glutamate-5-semialdehyde dehydrogenase [unclassified Spirosoma]|uniref:glutamate-5-semialdehyde dehydrogenase n=1 Tax=unclassified Spirosoma TaxID=2621999 RepID=UPI00095995BC|nr:MULTISPECIES: glutamate-5-semialdehyde dehydrogenase [unclassified Spirosoma]MBN8823851.1 glutamate-5-semialdehyde dehydrogenase [Spirosoma sp.]OJW79757.1 MAG: glutamate-5-semialdehyde dehydrogenase [Spirosoma sp. 48-14]